MDKHYWERYYQLQRQADPTKVQHSLFAEFVLSQLADLESSTLLELGCGNGRDSLFFASHNLKLVAIDQAKEQIDQLNSHAQSYPYTHKPIFIAGDFTRLEEIGLDSECSPRYETPKLQNQKNVQYDCIYSRFTLHSISKAQQDKVLEDCLEYCVPGGILAIEVRGERNGLFGKGEPVVIDGEIERNAFIHDDHYRRFLNFTQTCVEIESLRYFTLCSADLVDSFDARNRASDENIFVGGGI